MNIGGFNIADKPQLHISNEAINELKDLLFEELVIFRECMYSNSIRDLLYFRNGFMRKNIFKAMDKFKSIVNDRYNIQDFQIRVAIRIWEIIRGIKFSDNLEEEYKNWKDIIESFDFDINNNQEKNGRINQLKRQLLIKIVRTLEYEMFIYTYSEGEYKKYGDQKYLSLKTVSLNEMIKHQDFEEQNYHEEDYQPNDLMQYFLDHYKEELSENELLVMALYLELGENKAAVSRYFINKGITKDINYCKNKMRIIAEKIYRGYLNKQGVNGFYRRNSPKIYNQWLEDRKKEKEKNFKPPEEIKEKPKIETIWDDYISSEPIDDKTYVYDLEGNLKKIIVTENNEIFIYDTDGNLIKKKEYKPKKAFKDKIHYALSNGEIVTEEQLDQIYDYYIFSANNKYSGN